MNSWVIRGLVCAATALAWNGFTPNAEATEPFCPGGSSPDGKIVWCADADLLKNCPTGTEKQCWVDNGFPEGQPPQYVEPSHQWQVRQCTAAVGSGCFVGPTHPDGAGPWFHAHSLQSEPPFLTEASMRFYIRWSKGHSAKASHGPAFKLNCGALLTIQPDVGNWNFLMEGPSGCNAPNFRLFANQPPSTIPLLRDNKWHIIEMYVRMQTSWKDSNANGKADYGECNGIMKMWTDDALIMSYNQLCFDGSGSQASGIKSIWFPREYGHRYPPWGGTVEMDNMVVGVGPYSGKGPYIGRATGENELGTEDMQSPYYQYNSAMYHFACKNDATHTFCIDGNGKRNAGNIGARKSHWDCNTGFSPYSTQATGRWRNNSGELDTATYAPGAPTVNDDMCTAPPFSVPPIMEASLRISVDSQTCEANCGGGLQHNRTNGAYEDKSQNSPPTSQKACGGYACGPSFMPVQQVIYGQIYIPTAAFKPIQSDCNSLSKSCVVLSGFRGYAGSQWGHYVGLTVTEKGNWGIIQRHNNNDGKKYLFESTRAVTKDAWHEFELIVWNNNTFSLMVDRQRLATREHLAYSVASNSNGNNWLFCAAVNEPCFSNGAVEGIIDFPKMGAITTYNDNFAYGTMSYWSCDGWSAESCPFPRNNSVNRESPEAPSLHIQ